MDFQTLQLFYGLGWVTQGQMVEYVGYGVITTEEYEQITGEAYVA